MKQEKLDAANQLSKKIEEIKKELFKIEALKKPMHITLIGETTGGPDMRMGIDNFTTDKIDEILETAVEMIENHLKKELSKLQAQLDAL